MRLDFTTLDVFTDRLFGGNPLGVFPRAEGLSDPLMQSIARELNLSETVFLSAPETSEGTRRVRIFTPAMEVPFAGHPTVGAAFYLALSGEVRLNGERTRVVLEENVGPVSVEIRANDGRPVSARLTAAQAPEHRDVPFAPSDLAELVSLTEADLGCGDLTPEFVSCGLPFLVIPVRDVEAVRSSRLDSARWERLLRGAWSRMVYVVTLPGANSDVHVRMYAPGAGVPEDPATGSAAAALGGYLGARSSLTQGTLRWSVAQGVEMGRPSRLEVEAEVEDGRVVRVHVGGSAVMVTRGTMDIGARA